MPRHRTVRPAAILQPKSKSPSWFETARKSLETGFADHGRADRCRNYSGRHLRLERRQRFNHAGSAPKSLPVQSVEFPSTSGAVIHGWFLTGAPGKGSVILMHGLHGNRMHQARFLFDNGYSVLQQRRAYQFPFVCKGLIRAAYFGLPATAFELAKFCFVFPMVRVKTASKLRVKLSGSNEPGTS